MFDGGQKSALVNSFGLSQSVQSKQLENRASLDDQVTGKKKFESLKKNISSVGGLDGYHILSNLSREQMEAQLAYDGNQKDADVKKTLS